MTRSIFPASTTVWPGSETKAQLHMVSLVPRPFLATVLIGSSMPKWRGKAWEIQSHTMTLDRQKVDTQKAMPIITHKVCVDQLWIYWATSCIDIVYQTLWSRVLWQYIVKFLLCQALLPCHSMYMYMTKSPRPSPSIFAYCKWWNNVAGEGLGMRLWLASISSICASRFGGNLTVGP